MEGVVDKKLDISGKIEKFSSVLLAHSSLKKFSALLNIYFMQTTHLSWNSIRTEKSEAHTRSHFPIKVIAILGEKIKSPNQG